MAYRRRQGITRASTFKEEVYHPPPNLTTAIDKKSSLTSSHSFSPSSISSSSLAAQAIRASAAHRELSSVSSSSSYAATDSDRRPSKGFTAYEDESTKSESKGFWGVLARKAKAILEEDDLSQESDSPGRSRWQMSDSSASDQWQFEQKNNSSESFRKMDNPAIRRGLDKLTTSLNQIGDSFEKAFEEGRTIVENKTADIIQETRKLQIRRKGGEFEEQGQVPGMNSSWQPLSQPTPPQNHETQLKASRDVAMATAAKAKLLLRELKTVKADLAFAKARCSQLEEENKRLRDSREKGQNPADDDLIRLQLETLLAEKGRLANENSVYARENRFLREIVEYHQLTMQDVVYLDEGSEEVTEVYPYSVPSVSGMLFVSPTSPTSPSSPSSGSPSRNPTVTKEIVPSPIREQAKDNTSRRDVETSSSSKVPEEDEEKRPSEPSA